MTPALAPTVDSAMLKSWTLPACVIGGRRYQGHTIVVEAVDVTYQQKSHTHGAIGTVAGFTYKGTGMTAGGGGYIATNHESVATAVIRDADGCERQIELPAGVALRAGSVLRLDSIDNVLIGATNLSGKGGLTMLAHCDHFFACKPFRKGYAFAALIGLWIIVSGLSNPGQILTGVIFIAPLALWLAHSARTKQNRREMAGYMKEIWSKALS